MKQSTIIQVPIPLHAQLKALAKARDTTMTGVLAAFVQQAVKAGEIDEAIPGFELTAERGRITLGKHLVALTPEHARELADNLEAAIEPSGGPPRRVHRLSPADEGFAVVTRRGTGIEIDTGNGVRSVVTPAIARDLARQLRKAAKAAATK
jgi:hypothetical protein